MPFLKILSQLSPQVTQKVIQFMAKKRMIVNTVTDKLYDGVKGIQVICIL